MADSIVMDAFVSIMDESFQQLDDPRINRQKRHILSDIITITILAITCGADGWTEVVEYAESKKEWLEGFLEMPNGIPSHDTFGRVFSLLDPKIFSICFLQFVNAVVATAVGTVVSIDGKTIRGSKNRQKDLKAAHIVSAWSAENSLVLGQIKTEEKSNEITAIPKLLDMIDISGKTVTIDAMGTQTAIAEKIIEQNSNYILALKGNQGNLHQDIKLAFDGKDRKILESQEGTTYAVTVDGDHGRVETRHHFVIDDIASYSPQNVEKWPGLQSLGIIDRIREIGEKTESERSFFLLSETLSAEEFGRSVREHWSIENGLHWRLDVAFKEDASQINLGHAPENLNTLRKTVLTLLANTQLGKGRKGIAVKRKRAGWDNDFLLEVLKSGNLTVVKES